jgi:hypothetical protein
MRRALVVPLALALGAGACPAQAEEGGPVTGWWSRARIGAPSPVEAPLPFVPEGGTYVAGGSGGELAKAALRLELPDDERAVSLSLEVADSRGTPQVEVCPAAARWGPAQGGRYEDAPPADCSVSALGEVVEGRLVVPVEALTAGGPLDVVLRPAPGSAFSLSLRPATSESVTVVRSGGPGADAGDTFAPPSSDLGAGSAEPLPLLPDTPSLPLGSSAGAAAGPLLAGELPALPPAAGPGVAPQAAGPPGSRLPTRPSAASPLDDRATAVPAALLLLGMAALAIKLNGTPARAPVALGGAARLRARHEEAAGAPDQTQIALQPVGDAAAGTAALAAGAVPAARGVGRFRRERSGRPTPV